MKQLMLNFLESKKAQGRMSPASYRSYKNTYALFLSAGYTKVEDATLEPFLARYANPATRNKALTHLVSFAKWCAVRHPETIGVTVGTITQTSSKIEVSLPETVSEEDSKEFLSALTSVSNVAWSHAVIMTQTGMRFGEVLGIRRSHWVTISKTPYLRFRGKGRKERIVPLTPLADMAVRIWVNFVETHGVPHENTIRDHYRKALAMAGITSFRPHWMRHTVATKAKAAGASYDDIADLLGNSVEVVRERYAGLDVARLSKVVECL